MQVNVIGSTDKKKAEVAFSEEVFGCPFNEPLIHQVVTAYLAKARQGSVAQKNRSAVRGGGKKPWRQKGTGRARAGTIRSPIWRKGGVTFAATTQDYSQKLNKKMYRTAMCSMLSELLRQERLVVTDHLKLNDFKTKSLLNTLNQLGVNDDLLIVVDSMEQELYLAARNLPHVNVCDVTAVDPVSLVSYEKVLITVPAMKQFEEVLA